MINNLLSIENQTLSDNVTKQNLSTYINKYISDTIYILQLQINSFSNHINIVNNNSLKSYGEKELNNINDEINLIKKINKSLDKELFSLNNYKINDISKIIQVLTQRNELLNNLMNYYYTKQKIIETKEILLNNKIQNFNQNNYINNYNNKSSDRKYIKVNGKSKINFYIDNIKKNNEYNYKKPILNSQIYDNLIYSINNEDSFYLQKKIKNRNNSNNNFNNNLTNDSLNNKVLKNKIKKNFNESFNKDIDNLKILSNNNNNEISKNNDIININNKEEIKKVNNMNYRGRNKNSMNSKIKKRKVHSVKTMSNDSLNNSIFDINNNNVKFNFKNKFQLNKLNLEKLNDIISNILLIHDQNKNDSNTIKNYNIIKNIK